MKSADIREFYTKNRKKYEDRLEKLKRRLFLISIIRLAIFLCGIPAAILLSGRPPVVIILVLALMAGLFIYLLRIFAGCNEEILFTTNLIRINDNELKSLDGDYSPFNGGADYIDPDHEFSNDTDLFGENSLFSYLNRCVTGSGRETLAGWLSDPFKVSPCMLQRQEAVHELSARTDWRQHFTARGLGSPLAAKELENLNLWLSDKQNFSSSFWYRILSFGLPLAVFLVLVLVSAGLVPAGTFISLFILNLLIVGANVRKINRVHSLVSEKHNFLSSFGQMTALFGNEEFRSSLLKGIQGKLVAGEGSVESKIRELTILIRLFDTRLNMFAGFLLNGLFLWDFHCIRRLEKWRSSAATDLPAWLALLGEVDGLNSLAGYAFNNPDNAFPATAEDGIVLDASDMGHPLLREEVRVNNDFRIGKHGEVLIITGANMAGKSTFLRTVAVNLILAMTGAPVCARKMRFTPVKLFTSMRTTDSLSHNESYFYAELRRLRTLKERLEAGENLLFILDEILKGTNSTDKSLGSKLFLKKLIGLRATGLIATHDISLGEMENEFPGNVVNKCFEIEIEGEEIRFDYILRNGITRKMNAAVLMRQMGIV